MPAFRTRGHEMETGNAHCVDGMFFICSHDNVSIRAGAIGMGAFPVFRFFRLSDEGVRCDENGLFVGGAPLLAASPRPRGGVAWAARPADEQRHDLGSRYGFPVDVAAKREGLAGVARALEHGDLALAQVSALLLRFPDPPSLAKGARRAARRSSRGNWSRAAFSRRTGIRRNIREPASRRIPAGSRPRTTRRRRWPRTISSRGRR